MKKRIPIRILNIEPQIALDVTGKLTYLVSFPLSDDIYGLGKSVNTFTVMALLISNSDLKEDLGYDLLKMIFENIEYLKVIHERARDISIENALRSFNMNYLHNGAAKFFNEVNQNK